MTPPITGYRIVETKGDARFEYPGTFRKEDRAQATITNLRRTRPSANLAIETIYGRDKEAEMTAKVQFLASRVERVRFGLYRVPSYSEEGVVHTVNADPYGGLHCTCARGQFGECSHRRAVLLRRQQQSNGGTPEQTPDDATSQSEVAPPHSDGDRVLELDDYEGMDELEAEIARASAEMVAFARVASENMRQNSRQNTLGEVRTPNQGTRPHSALPERTPLPAGYRMAPRRVDLL